MQLTAYVFDNRGQLIGRGPVNAEGNLMCRCGWPSPPTWNW